MKIGGEWLRPMANLPPHGGHPGSYLNVPNTPCVTTLEITRVVNLTLNPISQFRTLASLAISKKVFFLFEVPGIPGWNHRLLNQILTQTSCREIFILKKNNLTEKEETQKLDFQQFSSCQMTAIEFESCFSFICLTLPWNVRSVCMILQHHRCADFESITPLCLL